MATTSDKHTDAINAAIIDSAHGSPGRVNPFDAWDWVLATAPDGMSNEEAQQAGVEAAMAVASMNVAMYGLRVPPLKKSAAAVIGALASGAYWDN